MTYYKLKLMLGLGKGDFLPHKFRVTISLLEIVRFMNSARARYKVQSTRYTVEHHPKVSA